MNPTRSLPCLGPRGAHGTSLGTFRKPLGCWAADKEVPCGRAAGFLGFVPLHIHALTGGFASLANPQIAPEAAVDEALRQSTFVSSPFVSGTSLCLPPSASFWVFPSLAVLCDPIYCLSVISLTIHHRLFPRVSSSGFSFFVPVLSCSPPACILSASLLSPLAAMMLQW